MWRLCSIATVFNHCVAVTKDNLWYSFAKLLFNQFFHTLCLHHWFLFPLWTWLFWISYSSFHIILSFFQWSECVLSLFSAFRIPQFFPTKVDNALLIIVLCTIHAGRCENIEWSWPWLAHVGSPPCVSAKSTTECTKCEHTHTCKCRDGFEIWPGISYCTTITLGFEHN